jgi:hypothetical protein
MRDRIVEAVSHRLAKEGVSNRLIIEAVVEACRLDKQIVWSGCSHRERARLGTIVWIALNWEDRKQTPSPTDALAHTEPADLTPITC